MTRRYSRTLKELRIKWRDETLKFEELTLDICPGGVFIVSNEPVHRGSILDLELFTTSESSVQCRGQVVWVNRGQLAHYPPGFGIQFLCLPEVIRDYLIQACTDGEGISLSYAMKRLCSFSDKAECQSQLKP